MEKLKSSVECSKCAIIVEKVASQVGSVILNLKGLTIWFVFLLVVLSLIYKEYLQSKEYYFFI